MAVKKSVKKGAARKATTKKAATRKTATKKTAARKAAGKKAAPKKKTAAKGAGAAGKTPARSKAAAKPKPEEDAQVAEATPAKKKAKDQVSSMSVNLGHVYSLRPRVSTSFRQADFLTARHLLQDESYENIEAATRAVVEKALEMTREGPSKRGFKPGR
jgi:hypothetical protein